MRNTEKYFSFSFFYIMLRLVIGPMWAGKTDHVIRLARRYRAIDKNVLFVDHVSNVRYRKCNVVDSIVNENIEIDNLNNNVTSHDGVTENCIIVDTLNEMKVMEKYKEAQVVIIEEAQFFSDLYEFVISESDKLDKDFICSGLSGDFERNIIGDMMMLVPHAEFVDKLNGFCCLCKDGTPGSFTKRLGDNKNKFLVGGKELYSCVCRKHYLSQM